jgi:hypothetical protein
MMKFLAVALIVLLAAGPVLAQDAMTPASTTTAPAKHKAHKGAHKHSHKKAAAPAAEAPAAQ